MIKKLFLFVYALCLLVTPFASASQALCQEIEAGKKIATRDIVESAVEEAIMCLQQLQGRLMEAVVHRWAEILKDYFEKLLSNQVNIQMSIIDEGVIAKSPRPGTSLQPVLNVDPRYLDPRDLYLRDLEVTGQLTAYDLVVTGSPACIILKIFNTMF